jgi:excisionase family DNA binding protein
MADPLDDLEMIGLQELSERFHISKRTLQHLVKTGRLPGVKIGRQWRVRLRDIRTFLEGDEDAADAKALEEARAEPGTRPFEEVRRDLGL